MGLEPSQALEMFHLANHTRQPHCWRVYGKAGLWDAIEKNRILRETLWKQGIGMPTDGIVIKVEEHRHRLNLGAATKTPKWAIAYKYPAERATTKLLDVIWQVGRTGKLTPVAILEPVLVSGSTVGRANLNNMSFIRNEIGDPRIGDTVSIYKGGEVIPQVEGLHERIIGGAAINAPKMCPDCGKPVVEETDAKSKIVSHWCENPNCPGRLIAHLIYIGKRECMNIDGLGDVIAERFVREEIAPSLGYLWQWGAEAEILLQDPAQQETFENEVAGAEFSVSQIRTLVESLARTRTSPWDVWLMGLGIPGIARELAKNIANFLVLKSEDMNVLADKLVTIEPGVVEGLGPDRIKAIRQWAISPIVQADLALLHAAGVRPASTIATITEDGSRPLEGTVICITGELGADRLIFHKILEGLGAQCKTGVSKKVNLLIVGNAPGKTKLTRAAELNIRTENESWLKATFSSLNITWPDSGMPSDEEMDDL
jgi:DNA ligase (NAD+)